MTDHAAAREAAWGEFRDGPDYQPTDRYDARAPFNAGFAAGVASGELDGRWVSGILGDISDDALGMLQDSNAHLSAAEAVLARIVNYCENQGDKFRHHSARILEMARPTIGGASRG